MKLLFWNLNRNKNEKYIVDLLQENKIDIAILAEYSAINLEELHQLLGNNYICYDGNGACDKITLWAKNNIIVSVRREQNRYTIYSICINQQEYIIVGLHL